MAKVKFTKNQQAAIDVKGGNILVSAAAGSGKTAVLTERVIKLLTGENPIQADKLVIVTFTVAAADEMKKRIYDKLSELIENDPTNQTLQSQQLLLENARISTIHSLCSSLIKENFQKLGLPSDIKIADETDIMVIKSQATDEIMETLYEDDNQDFLSLLEFMASKNDNKLSSLFIAIYDFIRSFSFPLKFLDDVLKMYDHAHSINDNIWMNPVKSHIISALSQCEAILHLCLDKITTDDDVNNAYSPAFKSDLDTITSIKHAIENNDFQTAYIYASDIKKARLSAVRNYEDREFLESLQAKRKKVYDILQNITTKFLSFKNDDFLEDIKILTKYNKIVFFVVKKIYLLIEQKKYEKGIIDYADLEHYALKLLINETEHGYEKSEISYEISKNIDEIMIDECQDINEVQNLIFTLLSKDETNLFMVGDVKQSVYRFRKAMPQLFIEKKDNFCEYDDENHTMNTKAKIILETNFRSRKEVCDIVNHIFGQIMSRDMGELDYTDAESLVAGATYEENENVSPEVHIIDYSNDNEDEKTIVEANYIATLIKKMIDEGYTVTENGSQRECKYSDFAILLRSKKDKAIKYANELKRHAIPYFSDSSEGYFDEYEITVIINILRVIDNPLLDLPLLSVLMSPVFSFSSDKIAHIRLIDKSKSLYLCLCELAKQGDVQCQQFIEMLNELRKKAVTMTANEIIEEIYEITDFFAIAYAMGDGEQKTANLRLLMNYALQYEKNGSNGLSGFIRYIDRVIESKGDFSCANVISNKANAVRIMSIHSSKGLEFPICIVADCAKKFNKMDMNTFYQLNSEYGFSMKINDPETLRSYTSFPFEAIKLQSEKETISEEMRVLYVALTRAKEKLIMVMTMEKARNKLQNIANSFTSNEKPTAYEVFSASSYADWILMSLLKHPSFYQIRKEIEREDLPLLLCNFKVKGYLVDSSEIIKPQIEDTISFQALPLDEVVNRLDSCFKFAYKNQKLTQIPAKLTVTAIAKQKNESNIQLNERPKFMQYQGITSAQRGTILHSFMQFADFKKAKDDLKAEINRLVENQFLTKTQAEHLNLNKINAFLHSNLYQRMSEAKEVMREYKFLHFIKAKEIEPELEKEYADEEILIQGIADCLLFEEDGIVIVDYKTDYVDNENVLIERYYDQLRIYKQAIESAFFTKVKQCLIYSLHMEKEIEIII